jgi:L-threonylcarbamoyladenylate synthase
VLYAAGLYAALHELEASAIDRMVIALPPDTPAWHAIHDRLRRASAPAE